MHQVCPLFPFWLLEEYRKVNDDRYSRIQYTPIYCFSGHQPYVPILLWNVLTGSLHVSPNSIWCLTSMTIIPSPHIGNPLQCARMMMLMVQSTAKWPSREDLYKKVHPHGKSSGALGSKSLYGKTAGFLVSRIPSLPCNSYLVMKQGKYRQVSDSRDTDILDVKLPDYSRHSTWPS